MPVRPLKLAIAQSAVCGDVRANGRHIRDLMGQAVAAGARLVQFPEAALSGYVKSEIKAWPEVDWSIVEEELAAIAREAARLGLWTVVGCNRRLPAPHWPQNCLYVISDRGAVAARYGKRFCSHSEVTSWYTPGTRPVSFKVDGLTFGCLICIEVCFPELVAEYERLGVDCVLLSSSSNDPVHGLMAQAHAATTCCWVAVSNTSAGSTRLQSRVVDPDGTEIALCDPGTAEIRVVEIDPQDPKYEVALRRARPWRALARSGAIYQGRVD